MTKTTRELVGFVLISRGYYSTHKHFICTGTIYGYNAFNRFCLTNSLLFTLKFCPLTGWRHFCPSFDVGRSSPWQRFERQFLRTFRYWSCVYHGQSASLWLIGPMNYAHLRALTLARACSLQNKQNEWMWAKIKLSIIIIDSCTW